MIASIVPIVLKTLNDRGDHMEILSSAIPAIGTIEAIAIARIAGSISDDPGDRRDQRFFNGNYPGRSERSGQS